MSVIRPALGAQKPLLSELVSSADGPTGPAAYLLQFSRRAMACEFELTVNAGQYGEAASHALAALDLVEQLEAQMSVFRESSEVTDINRRAAHEPVTIEPRLFQLLETCLRLYRETDGAMD